MRIFYVYESLTNTSESSDTAFEQKGVQNNENIFELFVGQVKALFPWLGHFLK